MHKDPPVHSGSGQTQRAVGVSSIQAAPRAKQSQVNLLNALRAQGPFFQTKSQVRIKGYGKNVEVTNTAVAIS